MTSDKFTVIHHMSDMLLLVVHWTGNLALLFSTPWKYAADLVRTWWKKMIKKQQKCEQQYIYWSHSQQQDAGGDPTHWMPLLLTTFLRKHGESFTCQRWVQKSNSHFVNEFFSVFKHFFHVTIFVSFSFRQSWTFYLWDQTALGNIWLETSSWENRHLNQM